MALRTLYQTLLDSDFIRLRVIAEQWQIALTAERKADAAAELADALARADAVERALAALPESSREALHDLLRRGGAVPWAIFIREWGDLRPVGPGRLEREALWRAPASPTEDLWYRGFIQKAFEERASGQVAMVFVPEELRLYLPPPPPLTIPAPEPVAEPLHCRPGDAALAEDLVTLWAALQVAAMGAAPSVWRDEALAQFAAPAAPRLTFLETLALEQGWLRREEDAGLRLAPEPVLTWLQADPWVQWERLMQAWIDSDTWNDLANIPALRPDPVKGWPAVSREVRCAFLDGLRHYTSGGWYPIAAFVTRMRAYATDFLRPDGDYDAWALRDAATDKPLRGFEAWDAVEGVLIASVLTGPLTWLGLVDLGGAAPEWPLTLFRLNPVGAALLGLTPAPTFPPAPPLKIQPDGLLVVPEGRRYERFQLSRVAQRVGRVSGETPGWTYRLTPASLARARQQHISLERLFSFLAQAAGQPVPPVLRTAIESAYTGVAQARLERVWLLRVTDAALLDSPNVRPYVREFLGPGLATIHESDYERVVALLTRSGVLPDWGGEPGNQKVEISYQKSVMRNE